jgi:hypothetical protein
MSAPAIVPPAPHRYRNSPGERCEQSCRTPTTLVCNVAPSQKAKKKIGARAHSPVTLCTRIGLNTASGVFRDSRTLRIRIRITQYIRLYDTKRLTNRDSLWPLPNRPAAVQHKLHLGRTPDFLTASHHALPLPLFLYLLRPQFCTELRSASTSP